MKITIDIEEKSSVATIEDGARRTVEESVDGGASSATEAAAAAVSTQAENDAGGPPEWLLDAIGRSPGEGSAVGSNGHLADAGAGYAESEADELQ